MKGLTTQKWVYGALLAVATLLGGCTADETESVEPSTGAIIGFNPSYVQPAWAPDKTRAAEIESPTIYSEAPDGLLRVTGEIKEGMPAMPSSRPQTRGAQIAGKGGWSCLVGGYYKAGSTWMSYFDRDAAGVEVTGEGTTATTYYWPAEGTMDFVAIAPVEAADADATFCVPASYNGSVTLTYEIPEDITAQRDVMAAVNTNIACPSSEVVGLDFQHLLGAVQFKVGKMIATRINSLKVTGVKGGAITFTYDAVNGTWSSASTEEVTYTPIYTVNGAPNVDTYGLAEGNFITSNENNLTMFVAPQELNGTKDAGPQIEISYTELITGTTHATKAPLSGHSWEAGKTTIYHLNIVAETLQITIPTPPDADAHYVRVDMAYDLSGLDDYAGEGITISNVTAKASWADDGSNTAGEDKQSIFLKTSLTEMQQKGYFTDELWELAYTIDEDGNKTYTKGSLVNGVETPVQTNGNILGTETLTLASGSSGTIYLFLDENNGTTDRNGTLTLTAKVTQNGSSREVVLGEGRFKQLCPYWNDKVGVERFEDADTHPYGFSYNRVVTYTNTEIRDDVEKWDDLKWYEQLYLFLKLLFTGSLMDEVLPDMSQAAAGFVTVNKLQDINITKSIVLNYGALNSVKDKANLTDGLENTQALYNYTGSTDIADLEAQLDETLGTPAAGGNGNGWRKVIDGADSSNPEYYAAYIALTRNRMRELKTSITADGKTTVTTKAILHEDSAGNDVIEWYLPSKDEAPKLKEVGTGTEATPISPLNGTYWTSTADEDPNATIASGYAYSMTFVNNAYSGVKQTEDRTNKLKVRAVRKQP
ncbi:MAG: fimbrillin family protein [Rikenellaceae bacterium]|nr:fimbrillin family protein [Rikenellaceae bacterium]